MDAGIDGQNGPAGTGRGARRVRVEALRGWVIAAAVSLTLMAGAGRPAWAQGGGAPRAGGAAASGTALAEAQPESFLGWMARASGLIGLVILGMSFYLAAVVVWMFLHYRREEVIPEGLAYELEELLNTRQYDRAYERLMGSGSFLARVLGAGVRKLPAGLPAAQRAMELANDDVTMEMEHRTTYLATVGTLGPMIGLVGTVYGMIRSFQAIATASATPEAGQLAAGISTALFVTLEGIALAVPAIAFYAYFRNRIARLSLEVQMTSEALLDRFAAGARTVHPLVTPTTAPMRVALPAREEPPAAS